jgi:hypothetical protein
VGGARALLYDEPAYADEVATGKDARKKRRLRAFSGFMMVASLERFHPAIKEIQESEIEFGHCC